MQPGDRFIGAFVTPQSIGVRFKEWPLHITIVSWCRGSVTTDDLSASLEYNLRGILPFMLKVGGEDWFANGKVLVNRVEQSPILNKIFRIVQDTEHKLAMEFVSTPHPSYEPHVTVQSTGRLRKGDTVNIDRLYIVELQKDGYKEIIAEVLLNGEAS